MTIDYQLRNAQTVSAALAAAQCGIRLVRPSPALADFPPFPAGGTSQLRHIMLAVSSVTGAPIQRIVEENRAPEALRPRLMFYWLARTYTKASLPSIGRFCAGRHHTTVLHGIRKVCADRQSLEPHLSTLIEFYEVQEARS